MNAALCFFIFMKLFLIIVILINLILYLFYDIISLKCNLSFQLTVYKKLVYTLIESISKSCDYFASVWLYILEFKLFLTTITLWWITSNSEI